MQLPRPVQGGGAASGGGARYNLVANARVESNGVLVARIAGRGPAWLARRIVVQGPAGSACKLYTGAPSSTSLADGTKSGALDVADYYQPRYIEPSVPLVAVWTAADGVTNVAGPAVIRLELEEIG